MHTIMITAFASYIWFGTIASDVINNQTKSINQQTSSNYEELKK